MGHHPLLAKDALVGSSPTDLGGLSRLARGFAAARRFAYHAFMLAGVGIGLVMALPARLPAAQECPPAGEGLIACQLTGGPLRSLTVLMLVMTASHLLARATLDWLPALHRKRRAGEPLVFTRPGTRAGAADHQGQLLAACWGDIGASRHPDPEAVKAAAAQWREARHAAQPTGLARLDGRITWPVAPAVEETAAGSPTTSAGGSRGSQTAICSGRLEERGHPGTGRRVSDPLPDRGTHVAH